MSNIAVPIKYFGGKNGQIWVTIHNNFPPKGSYGIYIEPFGGAFSVALRNPEPPPVEIYNDLEENVYSLYKCLQDGELYARFKEKCDLTVYSEQMRMEGREVLKGELSVVDRAFWFFYVNRMSHNGNGGFSITTKYVRRGMSKSVSDMLSAIDGLDALHQRMSRVIVSSRDGIRLIEENSDANTFIYADPPYEQSTRTSARYKVDMDRDTHARFIDAVNASNAKILISGYDCDLYRNRLGKQFSQIDFVVNTTSAAMTAKQKTETLWRNY